MVADIWARPGDGQGVPGLRDAVQQRCRPPGGRAGRAVGTRGADSYPLWPVRPHNDRDEPMRTPQTVSEPSRLVASLLFIALVVAAVGSLGAPLITSVATTFRVSLDSA